MSRVSIRKILQGTIPIVIQLKDIRIRALHAVNTARHSADIHKQM